MIAIILYYSNESYLMWKLCSCNLFLLILAVNIMRLTSFWLAVILKFPDNQSQTNLLDTSGVPVIGLIFPLYITSFLKTATTMHTNWAEIILPNSKVTFSKNCTQYIFQLNLNFLFFNQHKQANFVKKLYSTDHKQILYFKIFLLTIKHLSFLFPSWCV